MRTPKCWTVAAWAVLTVVLATVISWSGEARANGPDVGYTQLGNNGYGVDAPKNSQNPDCQKSGGGPNPPLCLAWDVIGTAQDPAVGQSVFYHFDSNVPATIVSVVDMTATTFINAPPPSGVATPTSPRYNPGPQQGYGTVQVTYQDTAAWAPGLCGWADVQWNTGLRAPRTSGPSGEAQTQITNPVVRFNSAPVAAGCDLTWEAHHEFGHSLGLGHTRFGGQTMYPTNNHQDTPGTGDIAGVSCIYGPGPCGGGWHWTWEDDGLPSSGMLYHPATYGSPNLVDVWATGGDRTLNHKYWDPSGGWHPWDDNAGAPPGGLQSAPVATSRQAGIIDAFGRGGDGALWQTEWQNNVWSPWIRLGGGLLSAPAVTNWGPNRVDIFVRGTDNALWHGWWPCSNDPGCGLGGAPSNWGWQTLGGLTDADPAAVSADSCCTINVESRGTDGQLWQDAWNGLNWGWTPLGGAVYAGIGPGVAAWSATHLNVYVTGTDGQLWQTGWDQPTGWTNFIAIGGALYDGPAATSRAVGMVDIFAREGINGGTDIWHKWYQQ